VRKLVAIFGLLLFLVPKPAAAHPLGNFSINVHLGIAFEETTVAATLIVDMAEIPTFQERNSIDASGDGQISPSERARYATEACSLHRDELVVSLDRIPIDLMLDGTTLDLLPGAAGLEIMRLECNYHLDLSNGDTGELAVANQVHLDRIGWREMTAAASGFDLETDLPVASPSELLTVFPAGPLEDRSMATIGFAREAGAVLAPPRPIGLVERLGSNFEVGWLALLTATGLGVAHALAPGHGKTLTAAYLVGRRGRVRHAAGLGFAVALSHTLGVGILGMVMVLTTSRFEPEQIYPWLSITSALLVTVIGAAMLYRALMRQSRDHHRHDHEHEHSHHTHDHGHGHGHGHAHEIHDADRPFGWRSLAALGLAGGLVPSASAVVLLLGAVSQGDPWFGVGLVAAFGIGMAIALIAAGIGAIWALRLGWRLIGQEGRRHRLERMLPALAGGSVTMVGLVLLLQAARTWS
jgi:nickel/cobalt transporter (NicO) family protein